MQYKLHTATVTRKNPHIQCMYIYIDTPAAF